LTPDLSAIGLYLDVFWNGMDLVQGDESEPIATGISPESPSNDAVFGPTVGATMQQGTPSITTVYQDSTIGMLDMESFYFGCTVATKNDFLGLPESCTMTATGYDVDGKKVASQTFKFVSNGGALQQMTQGVFNGGFKSLQRVDFSVVSDAVPKTVAGIPVVGSVVGSVATGLVAVLIDTVQYKVYSKNPFPGN